MKRFLQAAAAACLLAFQAAACEWTGISPATRISGRMVSPGYLKGKVVLLDRRDYCAPGAEKAVRALQATWAAYKTKPFILLGSHTGAAPDGEVRALMERLGATFPVYRNADAATGGSGDGARTRVLDSTGTILVYAGKDERAATGAAGSAIFATRRPSGARSWKHLLDWEIENLPGQAYLRLKELESDGAALAELKKSHKADAARYAEARKRFSENVEIKKLSKLVDIARVVKDRDAASSKAKMIKPEHIDKIAGQYESLKKSENPSVAQEAKNALADLAFAKATLDPGGGRKNAAGKRR